MAAVIVLGLGSIAVALSRLRLERVDFYLVFLSAFTIVLASRVTIKIPRLKSHVAVADTFVFLTLLLYGGEYAVLLSAVEAFVSSWRFCNKRLTVLFNASVMAISTTVVVVTLNALDLSAFSQLHGIADSRRDFVIALSVIALTQFGTNTALAAIYDSVKNALPLWETWKSKYIWTFFSYFIGAGAAGVIVQLSDSIGLGIVFATFPVIFFVFLTYRMYMKNVEISIREAEQAEEYARLMEEQSEALRESEERFRSAFNHAPIGIALVSSTGQWLKVNRALCEILGYTEQELLAVDFQSMVVPEDLGETLVRLHDLLTGKVPACQMEHRYLNKNGGIVWASWSASMASEGSAEYGRLIFQIQDITGKKSAEEKLQHDATHDALTGLPNRPMFMERLSEALARMRELTDYKASVLFIDLDRFKYVNDSLGHLIGDQLLKGISERLRECLRPSDLVARLGGDEFTILIEGRYDISEVTRVAERIQKKFSVPFELKGNEVYSSASIGILHASEKHVTPEDIMRDADTAMYQAKRAGKARHEVFDDAMHRAAKETLRLETDLRKAVERNEIRVFYQPIYSLANREIESLESLARWQHPELGDIPPSKFIPLAEEIGVIDMLSEHVLTCACRDIGPLVCSDGTPLPVSVNLSCRQFGQTTLVQNIERILREAGFSPERLRLEITESVFFEHQQRAVLMLNELHERGIEINIDDFGTGYSNLGYLMRLPITALKIDRSFVSMIDERGSNDEIVRAIVTLARNLQMRVVAEGVETASQLNALTDIGCEEAQGFYFAEPMQIDELREFLTGEVIPAHTDGFARVPVMELVQ